MGVATAYHEAGHVVAAWLLGFTALDVSIIRDRDSAGRVTIEPEEPSTCEAIARGDRWDTSRFIAEKRIMMLQAGEVAQRRYDPRSVRGHHSQSDRNISDVLLRQYAPDREKRDIEPHRLLLCNWTIHLIEQRWPLVEGVAETLLVRPELFGDQILDVLRTAHQERVQADASALMDVVEAIRQLRNG